MFHGPYFNFDSKYWQVFVLFTNENSFKNLFFFHMQQYSAKMLAEHPLTVPVVPARVEELIKLNRSCRVTLMRNGDEWFKGTRTIVNKTVNKTFGYFLNEVNQLPVSHRPDLAGGSGMGTR